MVRKMKLILRFLIISNLILFYFFSSISNGNTKNLVSNNAECKNLDGDNHVCYINFFNYKRMIRVKYDTCPALDMNVYGDELQVFCSPTHDYSNYIYYKYDKLDGKAYLYKYESIFGGNDVDMERKSFYSYDTYLYSLKKEFYNDLVNDEVPNNGFIVRKTYLYTSPNQKTNMYLTKGDKVLIISKKIELGERWYRVFYKNKKNIDMWIKADSVYTSLGN